MGWGCTPPVPVGCGRRRVGGWGVWEAGEGQKPAAVGSKAPNGSGGRDGMRIPREGTGGGGDPGPLGVESEGGKLKSTNKPPTLLAIILGRNLNGE